MTAVAGVWRYRSLVGNLARRELKLKYKGSALGWMWSLINPASALAIYTLVFGTFLRIEPPVAGNGRLKSFALFLFTGLIIWNLFSGVVSGSMAWLLQAGPLLKKVAFPAEAPMVAGVLSVLAQTAIEVAILVIVMGILGNLAPAALLLPFVFVLLVAFCFGLGLLVSILNVYYRDIAHLVGIAMNLLFYATPIIYPFTFVPDRLGAVPIRQILRLNPLAQFVNTARDLLYGMRTPPVGRFAYLVVVSVLSLTVGWYVFRRHAPDLSEEL